MQKNISTLLVFALFAGLLLFASESYAQLYGKDEQTRRQEHQAVKNYMIQKLGKLPPSSNNEEPKDTKEDVGYIDNSWGGMLNKLAVGLTDRKSVLMNGNKISTEVYNYGQVAPGYGGLREVNSFVWKNVSYVFAYGPIVGASVPDPEDPTKRIHVISDGLWDYPNYREVSPTGDTLWNWEPLEGYDDPTQEEMASNPTGDYDGDGKPDSWPRNWYNPTLGRYVWPGYLSQDATNADLEVLWGMDDRMNAEFDYYPFTNDTTRKGLGIQIEGRGFQWSNPLAENTIFFVYTITNVSDKDLDTVFFGIYGDPDNGGASPENTDDNGFFIPPYADDGSVDDVPVYARSLVYFWSPKGTGIRGLPTGYQGCKFLESPGNPDDGIDNDGDGMIDERQNDGIDNDGDWDIETDDIGIDGIPNTGDFGEGDGIPTARIINPDGSFDPLNPGEPNFEYTDLDEADQIGLTSFNSWSWSTDAIYNDESMWYRSVPRNFGDIQQDADIVFIFGSGYISLKAGETKRISMALLMGEDLDDLLTSAETVQRIYNENYRFFKPPITPTAWAVPDDKKVTLYWDSRSELSDDPLTGRDFEGYVIYRSTDPDFGDIQNITDGKGASFLSEPLKDYNGAEAKWDVDKRDEPFTDTNGNGVWDEGEDFVDWNGSGTYDTGLTDFWKGYHPVPYQGRGLQYYLGNNRGLVHSFVDSNDVINGQTYYYAVVAYDHGDSIGIPPTETTKKITENPITGEFEFDTNTLQVIPGPRTSGYVAPEIGMNNVTRQGNKGTGDVEFKIVDDLAVKDGKEYLLTFKDSLTIQDTTYAIKTFSVFDNSTYDEWVTFYDTKFSDLTKENIVLDENTLKLEDKNGNTYQYGVDYEVNSERGTIRRLPNSAIPNNSTCKFTFQYYPVYQSRSLYGQDDNPVFDGIEVVVNDVQEFGWDEEASGWIQGGAEYDFTAALATRGQFRKLTKYEHEIHFTDNNTDSALFVYGGLVNLPVPFTAFTLVDGVPTRVNVLIWENGEKDSAFSYGDEIILFMPGSDGSVTDTVTWSIVIEEPLDSVMAATLPGNGDVLYIAYKAPFEEEDQFTLKTDAGYISNSKAENSLDNIYVVPNPYIGYNDLEPTNKLPGQERGERRIYFENLPSTCTIRIYTLTGELVQEIYREGGLENGREYWNLLSKDGFTVAYGVYIAHIEAPGLGETIIKFALIK